MNEDNILTVAFYNTLFVYGFLLGMYWLFVA